MTIAWTQFGIFRSGVSMFALVLPIRHEGLITGHLVRAGEGRGGLAEKTFNASFWA
jgi:hypothetical protein